MGYRKCPKCELNYIRDDQQLCDICSRKYKSFDEDETQEVIMCSECGENPAMKGKDLCAECYKESLRQESYQKQPKPPVVTSIGMEDPDLEEVEVPIDDNEIPEDELTEVETDFTDDDQDDDLDDDDGDDDDDDYNN
ncbi:MAG: hypothetical protein II191_02860 [Clostridia bacterium]|nr:hypothetical protein [Clostridia bacterium]